MMWSEGGLERLRGLVLTRLRAVLGSDCPPLEPRVRTVLEQRLDSAGLDLMELIRRGEEPVFVPVEVKPEQNQVKLEPETSDLNIVCVKTEQEELEIKFRPEPLVQDQDLNHEAENFVFCPQCGSTLGAQDLQGPPPLPPPGAQPRCSLCGQSSSRELLLLEHNYTQDLQSLQGALQRGSFCCSVCGQDFDPVDALLEHMSQHVAFSRDGHGFDSQDSEAWSFEDDAFDETSVETICSICGNVFTDSEQLHEHLRTHLR